LIRFTLHTPQTTAWNDFAELAAASIPNYLVSKLGHRFGTVYYRHLARHPGSCSFVAYDEDGTLAGCLLATLDRRAARKLSLPVIIRLLLAANIRLLSPAFINWLARGIYNKTQNRANHKKFPAAELFILAVAPAYQGEGLALRLVEAMEDFFRTKGLRKPYLILTEKENLPANRFYEKLGAEFIGTYRHHGRAINQWHKALA